MQENRISKFTCTQSFRGLQLPEPWASPHAAANEQDQGSQWSDLLVARQRIYGWQILWPLANRKHVHTKLVGEGRQKGSGRNRSRGLRKGTSCTGVREGLLASPHPSEKEGYILLLDAPSCCLGSDLVERFSDNILFCRAVYEIQERGW